MFDTKVANLCCDAFKNTLKEKYLETDLTWDRTEHKVNTSVKYPWGPKMWKMSNVNHVLCYLCCIYFSAINIFIIIILFDNIYK